MALISTRAKWRSSLSGWSSVEKKRKKVLDNAGIVRDALHTTSSNFNFFNDAFGTQIGQLPLASPASGFIYSFDKSGVYTSSSESFGPLLAERLETIGPPKLFLALSHHKAVFD